jgi:hypothetical protein
VLRPIDWLNELDVPILAGAEGVGRRVDDLYFLSPHTQWQSNAVHEEFAGKAIIVPATVLPAYDTRFDILLRFLKRAGAVCVLYLGGKRTDFPKGTLMLAENLPLPLAWVPDENAYVRLIRSFYRRVTGIEHELQKRLESVRERLEVGREHTATLAAWLTLVERELQVRCELVTAASPLERPRWIRQQGTVAFQVPVHVGGADLCLTLTPDEGCELYQPSAEREWVTQLAGLLAVGTENVLLKETPGLTVHFHWSSSFEAAVFALMSTIPALDLRQPVHGLEWSDIPELVGSYSLARRLHLLPLQGIHTLHCMWLSFAEPPDVADIDVEPLLLSGVPYVYRVFRLHTLVLRDHALNVASHPRVRRYVDLERVACVPWRDWRGREGIAVLWADTMGPLARGQEAAGTWIHQMEARLRRALTGVVRSAMLPHGATAETTLRHTQELLEDALSHFLRLPDGVYGVHVMSMNGDPLLLMDLGHSSAAQEAMRILQPVLNDRNADALLQALQAYVECGARLQLAAQRLYIHRNTLRYRLRRIEELTGTRLDDAQTRLTFQLALRTWRMLHSVPSSDGSPK